LQTQPPAALVPHSRFSAFKESAMLDATLKAQLQQYMGMLRQPIRLIASLDDSPASQEMRGLLDDIVGVSDKISLDLSGLMRASLPS
jgi:alkyl hydroperoxide reductase subunit AhpF